MLLQIKNLSVEFANENSSTPAVCDLSFNMKANHITALVGESGSGKSATAFSILGLLPNTAKLSGEILYTENSKTTNLLALSQQEIKALRGGKIAMVFQEPMTALNPLMTCGQQVMEAIRIHQPTTKKQAQEKTRILFNQVELPQPEIIFNKYPHQLSGGQLQRVMIAMAIANGPRLLIADEPTTALDATVQKSILHLLKKLKEQQQLSILLISHDLGLVKAYADEVVVMYKGKMVEMGDCQQVLTSPQHTYTQALLQCKPSPEKKGQRLPTLNELMQASDQQSNPLTKSYPTKAIDRSAPILELKNLTVEFPWKKNWWGKTTTVHKVVNEVNAFIYRNEAVGLVGESGCGKTTLGKTILQLIRPSSGSILLHGQPIDAKNQTPDNTDLHKIQMVFQDPYGSLNPTLSIGEAIAEPIRKHLRLNKAGAKDKVAELLGQVGLNADHYHRYPHQFSGGQRQRISIARALAQEPSFLVFDESVSALDMSMQAQILNLIMELRIKYGFSCLFITHDLNVAQYLCDSIWVMQSGKIVETGSAEDVFRSPQAAYTRQMIEAMPVWK